MVTIPRISRLSLIALLAAAPGVTAGGPKAVAVEPTADYDVVAKGEQVAHVFKIRNEGDTPLEITDVSPACGCTVADYDRLIGPGELGEVRATLDTTDFGGPVAKSIAVFTNDPENPKLQLVIKASVRPYLYATPGYARFNYVQGEPIRPITQSIWADDGYDIEVLEVETPASHVKASYRVAEPEEREERATGRQYQVDIVIDPDSPVGPLSDYVEISLDHPKQRIVRIPVSGFVRPRQHVTPPQIEFGKLEASSLPLLRTVDFVSFITDGIEVEEIDTGVEGLEAEARSLEDTGHRFKVRLTLSPAMPRGEFSSTMKIHITDEQNPVVEVPIRGTVL